MRRVEITDERGTRRLEPEAFPIAIPEDAPKAHLGVSQNGLFVEPMPGRRVTVNGSPITTSAWLHDADRLEIGEARFEIEVRDDVVALRPTRAESARIGNGAGPIKPEAFEPSRVTFEHRSRGFGFRAAAFWLALAALGLAALFVFTARSVRIEIDPAPDTIDLQGPLAYFFGNQVLLHPGEHRLVAHKEGYRPLETTITVGDASDQRFRFTLQKLPGRLALVTTPDKGAVVTIDGEERGATPLEPIELEAGEHSVAVRADRYRDFETTVTIGGEGTLTTLEAALEPRFSAVTFLSEPSGATVRVDGAPSGRTPLTLELIEGTRRYQISLDGYKSHFGDTRVVAKESQTLGPVQLVVADGLLALESAPSEANVTIDGTFRGQTPLEIELPPGERHRVELAHAGYEPKSVEVDIESGTTREVTVELSPRLGEVRIAADPPDAELLVNGTSRGQASQTLELVAVPHHIVIRKEGYQSFETDVTPRPGFPQAIEVSLEDLTRKTLAELPRTVTSKKGHALRLIEPRRFQMGAPRREPGRRANEVEREVEIRRAFYLGTMEVTNRQFREFRSGHRSGAIANHSLEIDHHPAVQVSWEDAVAYCNWLSGEEGLAPAYVSTGGALVLAEPPTDGYRLPTEAEWELAARYATGTAMKYPWGDALPVAPGAGNFADASASGLVLTTVAGYRDEFAGTAPVDSFAPNALGIYNLGGNVAEWTNDRYAINPSRDAKLQNGVAVDPLGPADGELHVIRGSSFLHGSVTELRLSYRDYGKDPRPDVGFRLARWVDVDAEVTP